MKQESFAKTFALAIVACALAFQSSFAAEHAIRGTVAARKPMDLPPTAKVEVSLIDVSVADAPAQTIASTTAEPRKGAQIGYTLRYDPALLSPARSYALQVRITEGETLLFANTGRHAFKPGKRNWTRIHVAPVERTTDGPAAAPAAAASAPSPAPSGIPVDLTGRWVAEEVGGRPVLEGVRAILEFHSGGQIAGSGGCNVIRGQSDIAGERLAFGPIGSTRMACPPDVMDQEARFLSGLAETRLHKVADQELLLLSAGGVTLLRLARLP